MFNLSEFDLQSKENTGGVTGSRKVKHAFGRSYQLKPSILNAELYRQIKANQTDHENLGEVIAASIAQRILGARRAPKVSAVYDDENKRILVASEYLEDVVGTLDGYGKKNYLPNESRARHIKIVAENPDQTKGEIAWNDLPQTVRDTLAEAVVASAIVGDHDINPGNMMVLTYERDGAPFYEVARIDFGHAFNDLIHASPRFNGGLHDVDNPVFDFLNRTHLAGLFKTSEPSKLWRDYPGLMPSQELMNALLKMGNMPFLDIELGSEEAKDEFIVLIQLLQKEGDVESLAQVLNALKHMYEAISSDELIILSDSQDGYAQDLVNEVFDKIKLYCMDNVRNAKKAGETLCIQMKIDEVIKAEADIVISELPKCDWLKPSSSLSWLNLDGKTEGFHGTIEAYVRHRNEQLAGNSICIATRSNPEAEKTYKKQLKQLRVMSEFSKTEQTLLLSIENSKSLLVSSGIAHYEEKSKEQIEQYEALLLLSTELMNKFRIISDRGDILVQQILSEQPNELSSYVENCTSLVNAFNELYLSQDSKRYLDNLLVLASSTEMLQIFLNKLSPYRYRLEGGSIDGQTISSYMIAPLQRFPRYRLLFEELGKADLSIQPSIAQAKEYSATLNRLIAIESGSLKAKLSIESAKKMYDASQMPAYVLNCIASCPMIASEKIMLINERNAWIRTLLLSAYPDLFEMNDMAFIVRGAYKEEIEAALGITQAEPDFCPNRFNHELLEALYLEKNEPLWRVLKAIQPVELTKEGCPVLDVLQMFSQARMGVEDCFDMYPELRLGMEHTEFYSRQYDRLKVAEGFVKKHSENTFGLEERCAHYEQERLSMAFDERQASLSAFMNSLQGRRQERRAQAKRDDTLGLALRKWLESEMDVSDVSFLSPRKGDELNGKMTFILSLYPDLFIANPVSEEESNKQARVRRALGCRVLEGKLFIDIEQFDYSALLELYQDDHNPLWLVLASSIPLITPLDVRTVFEDQQYIKPSITFKAKIDIYLQIAASFRSGTNIVCSDQDAIICPTDDKAHKGAYQMLCLAYDLAVISKDPELITMVQASCDSELGNWIKSMRGFEESIEAVKCPEGRERQNEIMNGSKGGFGKQLMGEAKKVSQTFRNFFTHKRDAQDKTDSTNNAVPKPGGSKSDGS